MVCFLFKKRLLLALALSSILILVAAHEHSHSHDHAHTHTHDHDHKHDHDHHHHHDLHSHDHEEHDQELCSAEATAGGCSSDEFTLFTKYVGPVPECLGDRLAYALLSDNALYSYTGTFLISSCSLIILGVLIVFKSESKESHHGLSASTLNYMTLFAVGGLLGDVFLHLLPHAMGDGHGHDHGHSHDHGHDQAHDHAHDHDHHHNSAHPLPFLESWISSEEFWHRYEHAMGHMQPGLMILVGIIVFFVLEKSMRGSFGHDHHHHHEEVIIEEEEEHEETHSKSGKKEPKGNKKGGKGHKGGKKHHKGKKHSSEKSVKEIMSTSPGAILNLGADAAHNVTDGLAISASFIINWNLGISTTAAIFFHELPHEVADFAILLRSGFSYKNAFLSQVLTAVGAFVGTFLGLFIGNLDSHYISAILQITAGGFIYVALVNFLPEMLHSKDHSVKKTIFETFMILLGVSMMFAIGFFE